MHMYSTFQSSLFPNFDTSPLTQIASNYDDNASLPLADFLSQYPQYRMSGVLEISEQARVLDETELVLLPKLLVPAYPYQSNGHGRRNRNETLSHCQCYRCRRVIRNDFIRFGSNGSPKGCRECETQEFKDRYAAGLGNVLKIRRECIWKYLAPQCMACRQEYHPAVMHMHHLQDKKFSISRLVGQLAQTPTLEAAIRLVDEANKCVPLCANCHAMDHAGLISGDSYECPDYDAAQIMQLLSATKHRQK